MAAIAEATRCAASKCSTKRWVTSPARALYLMFITPAGLKVMVIDEGPSTFTHQLARSRETTAVLHSRSLSLCARLVWQVLLELEQLDQY